MSRSHLRSATAITSLAVAAAALSSGSPAFAQFSFFEVNADNPAGIQTTVDSFRTALGNLNGNLPQSFPDGRRQIDWDAVPDAFADPNPFPGDFFNGVVPGRARGATFSTPGTGFLVSADNDNPTATPPRFGFPTDFVPFSEQRLFSPVGSTITDIRFTAPGTNIPATTTAFGAVFNDVEFANLTQIEFFDMAGNSLLIRSVLAGNNGGLSFLGVQTVGTPFALIRITTGDSPLLGNGSVGAGSDTVVMDDFIFAEQTAVAPEPGAASLALMGLAPLGIFLRRRK